MGLLTVSGKFLLKTARGLRGFTLIELLVVLAIVATLLTIAVPRYFGSIERAKEAALKQNLFLMRDAIDKHFTDQGVYPMTLQVLVDQRYLRFIPADPFTGSVESWVLVAPPDSQKEPAPVYDVRSAATGRSKTGEAYSSW